MTYESAQSIFGIIGLLLFLGLFLLVLAVTFWPGTRKSFDEASRIPLEREDLNLGGSNGR
jgi:cytochrome c oxidase cbb3-type subunit IV